MPIRKVKEWPVYQITSRAMYAFMGPCDMYKIENVDSNSGCEGVCIDHYITRRMVRKHLGSPEFDVDWTEFRERYDRLFTSIRGKIVGF